MNQKKIKKTKVERLPNIVYILADDLGYGDLSSLNPKSGIKTPNMDKVVKEGIHFTDAHSNSSVCTPTRYGILTGRYAWRSVLKKGVLGGYDEPLIENNRATVASYLSDNGYHTACIGKWHLGLGWELKNPERPIVKTWELNSEEDSNVDFSQPINGGPKELGFDYSYIIPASLDMSPYLYLENDKAVTLPTARTAGKGSERGVFWRAGEMAPNFDFHKVLPTISEKAVDYIEGRSNSKSPFFLYFPLTAPHTPWLPDMKLKGVSEAGKYGDFVSQVDGVVGEILSALEESGQADNTLLIITSDNGAHWTPEDKEKYAHRANFIYRGQKADIYEGGHHIPYIARWPGKISAGSNSNQVLCTTDLMATVSGVINRPLPVGAGEDSYNMLPAYLGTASDQQIRDYTIHHAANGFFSIRKGKWKLTPHLGSGGFSVPVEFIPENDQILGTLYDMENDPQEITNLYGERADVVEVLMNLLEQAKK
ncbi:arylsulfatase [Seonamhaeicola sp.]|uniref:sulfatase family protein n=1 Tax=Seonamhaeicola sp. TaxID=1912245 RepID=UPI0026184C72|nr:arylsulfatase [Seonamhaeicola sp.]